MKGKYWIRRLGRAFRNRFWGALFGMNPLTAFLSAGWSQRRARQNVLRSWVLSSPYAEELRRRLSPAQARDQDQGQERKSGASQRDSAGKSDLFLPHPLGSREGCELIRDPHWILPESWPSPRYSRTDRKMIEVTWRDKLRAPFQSLARNWKFGWQGVFPTATLLVPTGGMLWFAWRMGWNNSFHKGYEQAPIGPLVSFIGIGLFIWFWSHIPMAQACQAASGEWKRFYRWKLIRKLIWIQPMRYLGLLALYLLLAIPIMMVESAPGLITSGKSKLEFYTAGEAVEFLRNFHFMALLLIIFPAFAWLKKKSGQVYAEATLQGIRSGKVSLDELSEWESEALKALSLDHKQKTVESSFWSRLVKFAGRTGSHILYRTTLGLVGFGLIGALFYIPQFIGYQPFPRWVNPVMIQLPWYHRLPGPLKERWNQEKLEQLESSATQDQDVVTSNVPEGAEESSGTEGDMDTNVPGSDNDTDAGLE